MNKFEIFTKLRILKLFYRLNDSVTVYLGNIHENKNIKDYEMNISKAINNNSYANKNAYGDGRNNISEHITNGRMLITQVHFNCHSYIITPSVYVRR